MNGPFSNKNWVAILVSLYGALLLSATPANLGTSETAFPWTLPQRVYLIWEPSTSTVAGYNVYRAIESGGPYTRLNSELIMGNSFVDVTVQAGRTYFYTATAVGFDLIESLPSDEVAAVIPLIPPH